MSLKKQIEQKLNEALKAKDKNIYPTLRLVVSAIKDAEIAGRSKGQKEIKVSDIISLLKKMIKQRNESCEVYQKAGRKELLENEKKEIDVINVFLPKQLSEDETKKISRPRNKKTTKQRNKNFTRQRYKTFCFIVLFSQKMLFCCLVQFRFVVLFQPELDYSK